MTGIAGYAIVPDILMEPLGDHWAVFSPASGESHLVNDSSAALLEIFKSNPAISAEQACSVLAADVGLPVADVEPLVSEALRTFVTAGLVRVAQAALPHGTIGA